MPGCAKFHANKAISSNYQTVETSLGDEPTARLRHEEALGLINDCCLGPAEQKLHESLIADKSFGPAHNTLGKLYFDQEDFYRAAWEFEYAIKTMPSRPEPINNLGLVYEAVGRLEGAISRYEEAYALAPESAEYLGNLVRARIRNDEKSDELKLLLDELIFLETRPSWVRWAKLELVKQDQIGSELGEDFPLDRSVPQPEILPLPTGEENAFPVLPAEDAGNSNLLEPINVINPPN